MTKSSFSIGELARSTGTKVETIRYYERIGVLQAPVRTSANYRAYARSDVERLSFVRRARELGFTLDQVRALLRLSDDREQSCAEVDRLAGAQLAEVDRRIADLKVLRRELSDLIGQCRHGTIADCRIIEVLGSAFRPQPGA
jgi:Cu(I)-responsive transcriptional regulator